MKKRIVKVLVVCVLLAAVLVLPACEGNKLSFKELIEALQNSSEPYLVDARVSYSQSGVTLTSGFKLEIGKSGKGYAAKYSWENQEAASFDSGGQFIYSSGSDFFITEQDYKSLQKQVGISGQNFLSLGAPPFEIKKNYFLSFEFLQEEGEDNYYFFGELNGIGKKAVLGEIAQEASKAFVEIKVLKKEQRVMEITLSYQYVGGGETEITVAYGYALQEIKREGLD